MSDVFEVKTVDLGLPGTLSDALPFPLFKVPSNNGAVTFLGAQIMVATAMVVGTVNLIYGTLSATNGTVVPEGTIGTSFGTGGGTFPAMCLVSLTLTNPTIPENKWVAIKAGTLAAAGQNVVHIQYVNGRCPSA